MSDRDLEGDDKEKPDSEKTTDRSILPAKPDSEKTTKKGGMSAEDAAGETLEMNPKNMIKFEDKGPQEEAIDVDISRELSTQEVNELLQAAEKKLKQKTPDRISFFNLSKRLGGGGQGSVYEGFFNPDEFERRYDFNSASDEYIAAKREAIKTIEAYVEKSPGRDSAIKEMRDSIKARIDSLAERNSHEKDRAEKRIRSAYALILGREMRTPPSLEEIAAKPIAVKVMDDHSLMPSRGFTDLTAMHTLDESSVSPIGRFKKEHEILEALKYVDVIKPIVFACEDGKYFMAMEKIDTDLKSFIRNKKKYGVKLEDFLKHAYRLTEVLKTAHKLKYIHRDIKPDNIGVILENEDIKGLRLMDWGIVKKESSSTLTQEGVGMGTPEFAAPEQFVETEKVNPQTDIYALGGTFIYMLTGRYPRESGDYGNMATILPYFVNVTETEIFLREAAPSMPEALEDIIIKMTESDLSKRYASVEEVEADLLRFQKGEKTSTPDYSDKKKRHYGLSFLVKGENRFGLKTGKELDIDFMDDAKVKDFLLRFRELVYGIKLENIVRNLGEGEIFLEDCTDERKYARSGKPTSKSGYFAGILLRAFRATGNEAYKKISEQIINKTKEEGFYRSIGSYAGSNEAVTTMLLHKFGISDEKEHILKVADSANEVAWTGKTYRAGTTKNYENRSLVPVAPSMVSLLVFAIENGKEEYRERLDSMMNFLLKANLEDNKTITDRYYEEATERLGVYKEGKMVDDGKRAFLPPTELKDANYCQSLWHTVFASGIIEYYKFSKDERFLKAAEGMMDYYLENVPESMIPFSDLDKKPRLDKWKQNDAAIYAVGCFRELHEITGNEKYKKAERDTLRAVINNIDMDSDSELLVKDCTVDHTKVNFGRIEAFYQLMRYVDEFVEKK